MSDFDSLRANGQSQPKQMSSRLLTMKFMQRASSTNTKSNTNRIVSTSQPTTPASEPSLKRQKTEHTPDSSLPTTPATEPQVYASRSDIKAALQAESAFEALARAKRAELGFGHNEYETEWVLNVSVPGSNAQATSDTLNGASASESEEEQEQTTGRQTYGGYKRRKPNTTNPYATPGSKTSTPVQSYRYDDFDSNSDSDLDDGEIDTDSDTGGKTPGSSSRKRKANVVDEDDETAMSALDRTDLSKTGYAKAKKATPSGKWTDQANKNQKKGKWQGRGSRGKKLGRNKG